MSYKSPKQSEVKQSRKPPRALHAHWALPVYPAFKDEKWNRWNQKLVNRKIASKKTDRTNIIATNFESN